MKRIAFVILWVAVLTGVSFAWENPYEPRPYKDAWSNSYKNPENLYKDTDKDGVINMYDYNDKNKNIQTPYQQDYNKPVKQKHKPANPYSLY